MWVAAAMLFAECGLLLGFFLPGDTLLFTVGIFVSTGLIGHSIWFVCVVLSVAAVLGNVVGYEIGRVVGPPIFERKEHRLLKKEQIDRTHGFFEKYGSPAIFLARFVPVVRTVITVVAGVAKMDPRRYLTYSVLGGVVWASGMTLLGWGLGRFQFVKDHIEPHLDLIVLGAVVLSSAPVVIHLVRESHSSRKRRKLAPDGAPD